MDSSSSTTMYGVCFKSDECSNKGGTASGNCASGFGVCCFFKKDETDSGDTISNNLTYIQNTDYPSAFTSTTTATFTYSFGSTTDICQVRLDFADVSFVQPSSTGACTTDTMTITTVTGLTEPQIPKLCGKLTGSHMYFETAMQNPGGSIALSLGTSTTTRTWKIKVSYIECGSVMRAPNDCLQYHTGQSGRFKSFNGASTQGLIHNQMYNVCVRRELGFCGMDISESTTTTSPDPFLLLGNPTTDIAAVGTACTASYIIVPVGHNDAGVKSKSEKFCGQRLSAEQADTVSGTIRSDRFRIGVFVASSTVNQPDTSGFDLTYTQIPCNS